MSSTSLNQIIISTATTTTYCPCEDKDDTEKIKCLHNLFNSFFKKRNKTFKSLENFRTLKDFILYIPSDKTHFIQSVLETKIIMHYINNYILAKHPSLKNVLPLPSEYSLYAEHF